MQPIGFGLAMVGSSVNHTYSSHKLIEHIQDSTPKGDDFSATVVEDALPQKKVVFIGNLPINQPESFIQRELETAFSKYGPRSMNFHLAGPKPYAFIEFEVSLLPWVFHIH